MPIAIFDSQSSRSLQAVFYNVASKFAKGKKQAKQFYFCGNHCNTIHILIYLNLIFLNIEKCICILLNTSEEYEYIVRILNYEVLAPVQMNYLMIEICIN